MEVAERPHDMLAYEVLTSRQEEHCTDRPLLTEFERQQLEAWNATQQDYPQDVCVPQLVAMQTTTASPRAMAAVAGEQMLSYRELNRRANQLARYPRTLCVGPNVLVGCRKWPAEPSTSLS